MLITGSNPKYMQQAPSMPSCGARIVEPYKKETFASSQFFSITENYNKSLE